MGKIASYFVQRIRAQEDTIEAYIASGAMGRNATLAHWFDEEMENAVVDRLIEQMPRDTHDIIDAAEGLYRAGHGI